MKHLKTGMLWLTFSLLSFLATAQKDAPPLNEPNYNKPKLFADVPQKFIVNIPALETLFNLTEGETINALLTKDFRFQGVVVSKSNPSDTAVKSIVIRSSNRNGATFTFTRIRNQEGAFEYIGHILSLNNSDAFELVKEGNGYALEKKHLYDIFSE